MNIHKSAGANTMNEELLKRLDLLAVKLGATGQYLWETLVKREFAEGVWSLGMLGMTVAGIVFLWQKLTKFGEENPYDKAECAAGKAILVIGGLGLIDLFSNTAVLGLLNPEGQALKTIFELMKG